MTYPLPMASIDPLAEAAPNCDRCLEPLHPVEGERGIYWRCYGCGSDRL